MLHFHSPMGSPDFINQLEKSFPKARRGITFPPTPKSTLHERLALFFDATGISTFAKASVIASMEISVRVISFGSLGLFWMASQACIVILSSEGMLLKHLLLSDFQIAVEGCEVSWYQGLSS